jgi:N-acetylmuramoyl-L-alanine amidase/Bacterial SH3 domain
MQTKFGFTKMNVQEFDTWLKSVKVARTIVKIQEHHTYIPNYSNFTGSNHFELQKGMQNTHKYSNGWMDIGQHFSIFPDGSILTGRSLEYSPACIYNNNANSVCIENVGNFDSGGDSMTTAQRDAIIEVTALLCIKFNLLVDVNFIIYHHWFRLNDGFRNNGAGGNKSCPGTNFFGGNKVNHCQDNFLPLVTAKLQNIIQKQDDASILKYASVTATSLNVRVSHSANSVKADRDPVQYGAVLRVYEIKDDWYKISNSADHWVSSKFTRDVTRHFVKATTLNVRSGPGSDYAKVGQIYEGDQVFVEEVSNKWARITATNNWVSQSFLTDF